MVVARAVHEVVVGPEQPRLGHPGVSVGNDAVLAPARMRRGHQPELARHADVVLDHLPRAPVGTEDRHRQRHAAVVAREPALAQRFDAVARMRDVGERRGALPGRRLGGAVREHGADAAVDQAVDRTLGQLERGDVVAPVDERRHAGVDLRQRADQVAEIIVLGLVARRQIEMHVPQVVGGHPFRADAAQRRLPGVHMRVHQARHHDLVGGVDHLVGGRIEIAPDGFDPIAAEQKLPALEVADRGIERDQPAAFDQNALHWNPCDRSRQLRSRACSTPALSAISSFACTAPPRSPRSRRSGCTTGNSASP